MKETNKQYCSLYLLSWKSFLFTSFLNTIIHYLQETFIFGPCEPNLHALWPNSGNGAQRYPECCTNRAQHSTIPNSGKCETSKKPNICRSGWVGGGWYDVVNFPSGYNATIKQGSLHSTVKCQEKLIRRAIWIAGQ